MSRKWYTLGLLVFAAACGGAEDDTLETDGFETQEETTVPATPSTPMDTTMMQDTMMQDTMGMGEDAGTDMEM